MKLLSLLIILTFLGVPVTALSEGYEQADIYRDLRAQALRVDAQLLEAHGGIFALLDAGHFQVAKGGSIRHANQQLGLSPYLNCFDASNVRTFSSF